MQFGSSADAKIIRSRRMANLLSLSRRMQITEKLIHLACVAHHHRDALMQRGRRYVQHGLSAVDCPTPCLLHDHADRIAFIHEAQLARPIWLPRVPRVEKDPSSVQDALDVRDHRTRPTHTKV